MRIFIIPLYLELVSAAAMAHAAGGHVYTAAAAAKAAAHAAVVIILAGDDAGGDKLIGNGGLVGGKVQGGLALPVIPCGLVLFAVLALDGATGDKAS